MRIIHRDSEETTEVLPVKLTTDEIVARATELARLHGEQERADADLKAARDLHRTEREERIARQSELARYLRERQEPRKVKVRYQKNDEEKTVELWRLDTGELVESRPMDPVELQRSFDDVGLSAV